MRTRLIIALVLLSPLMAVAQADMTFDLHPHAKPVAAGSAAPEFPFPAGFKPPEGLFDEFWKDPACAAELHLSDAQRKQLQEAALAQRLALIDSGADIFKGFVKLSAILDAEPYDDAAYKQQLNEMAASTGRVVQNVGEMAATPRRILTSEQWAKLEHLKRAKQAAAKAGTRPKVPSSLQEPMPQR